jgi:hypothetical protein
MAEGPEGSGGDEVKIIFSDNSKLMVTRVQRDVLTTEIWKPANLKDGHGWQLQSSARLAGDELAAFVCALTEPQTPEVETRT